VHSFTDSDLSIDTDNIVPFENTILINLINLLFYFVLFIWINRSGIFEQYSVISVGQI